MARLTIAVLLILSLMAIVALCQPPSTIKWVDSYNQALKLADAEDKPVFIYFYSSKCVFCKLFEKYILSDPDVSNLLNKKFISVAISLEENGELALSYEVVGTPTSYFLYPNGTSIGYIVGYVSKKQFMDSLRKVLDIVGRNTEAREDRGVSSSTTLSESRSSYEKLIISIPLAITAGAISVFSPCILPLIPVVLLGKGLVSRRNRLLALMIGLTLSYTLLGVVAGTVGYFLKDIAEEILYASLIIFGLILVSDKLSKIFVKLSSYIPSSSRLSLRGVPGGFMFGAFIGIAWSPCIGPIISSILINAVVIGSALEGALIMFTFSLGFALSLVIIVKVLGDLASKGRKRRILHGKIEELILRGRKLERVFGIILIILGIIYLMGLGRELELLISSIFSPK